MLSETERRKIEAEAAGGERRSAAVTEALFIVQESRGWVSDDAVVDIAEALGMGAAEVDAVATFFDLVFRRPVGKHVILACDSVSCWIEGSEPIAFELKSMLGVGFGETTADGLFTLLPVGCLGACEQAPAMLVDGELYGNLTRERVGELISSLREGRDVAPAHR
jgi:NADH-quinone oxidoreductase subunit E